MGKVNLRGFTLVEMLIVCAIFFIATTAGAISFSRYNTAQTLDVTSKNIVSFLNNARVNAVTQTIPSTCTQLQMYKVTITPPSLYEMYATCGATDILIKKDMLPNGISFKSGTSNQITFVIGNGISNSGTVIIGDATMSKNISIDTMGNITIN